jgi:hypothetical protein
MGRSSIRSRKAQKRIAVVSLPLASLDAVRGPLALSLEDVILSIVCGALARYLREEGGEASGNLRALISLPLGPGRRRPIEVGVPLPLNESDPARRAERLRDITLGLHSSAALYALEQVERVAAALPPSLSQRFNVGQAQLCDLRVSWCHAKLASQRLAGAEVLRVYPLSVLDPTMALSIGAFAFARRVCLGVLCDADLLPQPRILANALRAACGEFIGRAALAPGPRAS